MKITFPKILISFLKLAVPFLVWMALFRPFLSGEISIGTDTYTIFATYKYYFNNLINGVLPLWEPFNCLGRHFGTLSLSGIFNPLIYVMPLLVLLGVDYYNAFIVVIVLCYFVSVVGFYFLAKAYFKNKQFAFLAYLMILFSGIGANVFNQFNFILLFLPGVWFFFFLLKFFESPDRSFFLGLTFSLMLVMTSYLPFYLITVFLAVFLFASIISASKMFLKLKEVWLFIKENKKLLFICLLGLCVSLMPLLLYKAIDSTEEMVSPVRQCNNLSREDCYNLTMSTGAGMSYKLVSATGGLGQRLSFRGLFTHLDKLSYASDSCIYLTVFAFILMVITMFTGLTHRSMVMMLSLFFVFLISLSDATPVHEFLYDSIFYFKYFRNFFFFIVFLIPMVVLFSLDQIKNFMESNELNNSYLWVKVFWICLAHVAIFMFLFAMKSALLSAYATVFISGIFFITNSLGKVKVKSRVFLLVFVLLTVLHPMEVMFHYRKNVKGFECAYPREHVNPTFLWKRETVDKIPACKIFSYGGAYYRNFWQMLTLQDSTGVVGYPIFVSRWAFDLSQRLGERKLHEYARNKLVVYDHVDELKEGINGLLSLKSSFTKNKNVAFVVGEGSASLVEAMDTRNKNSTARAQVMGKNSGQLKVLNFNVNALKISTRFSKQKFLVYNDSFTSFWKVFVNGREEKLWRANGAFKGVYLPKGENIVHFIYSPVGGSYGYVFVLGFFFVFMIASIAVSVKKRRA